MHLKTGIAVLAGFMLIQATAQGQRNDRQLSAQNHINGSHTKSALKIDGILNEDDWGEAKPVAGFWMHFPSDTSAANHQTQVKVLYNEEFLYVGAVLDNPSANTAYVASSLRRDYPFSENDAFGVILDTYLDQTNGYGFYVSSYGVQREEQIFGGATTDAIWDAKWFSAVSRDSSSWVAEIAIPFSSIRFKKDFDNFNINFLRNNVASNEQSSWARIPRNFLMSNLAYHGQLHFTEQFDPHKRNISFIPSFTYTASQQKKDDIKAQPKLSLDTKVAVSPSLNLDVTINPDFSQAEVDQVQLNITRFELVFPEKRFFFIENSDLFSEFGITQVGSATIRPFYSRRIGLRYNDKVGQYERTRILGGLRLSGKLNENLRIGAMSMQTAELDDESEGPAKQNFPGQNYSVLALQQKLFSRSNIGIIVENRQAMKSDSLHDFRFENRDYSRLVGVEYNLASHDGKWTGKAFTNYLWRPGNDNPHHAHGALLQRNTERTSTYVGYTKASGAFNPDMGFVPRQNFLNFYTEVDVKFYSKKPEGKLNFVSPIVHYDIYLDSLNKKTDHQIRYGFHLTFRNTSYMYILGWHEYTRLLYDFNPAQDDGPKLGVGSEYNYSSATLYYESDYRKTRFFYFWFRTGQYFNGYYTQSTISLNQKIQPWGVIGLNYDMNVVELPRPFSTNTIFAIGPKAEISFNRSIFLNTIVQYNSQFKNIDFYGRFQWRFRPLSDFYIIYTNNSQTRPWMRQHQALTVKLVYWI